MPIYLGLGNNIIIIKTKVLLPQVLGDLIRVLLSCLDSLVLFLPKILIYLALQPFDFKRT